MTVNYKQHCVLYYFYSLWSGINVLTQCCFKFSCLVSRKDFLLKVLGGKEFQCVRDIVSDMIREVNFCR